MDTIVCIKRVPATDSKIRPGSDGRTIDPQGVEHVLNPYDEFAVEEALRIKEARGGKVTVLCLGPAEAQKEIRTCLAMGCDEAVLLKDAVPFRDACSTAEILAGRIKEMSFDLVLFGKQAVDGDNSQVGQRVATLLDVACVHEVSKLTIEEGRLVAERDIEGGREVVEGALPAVVTAQKGLNEPRYASLKGIMAAKKKPLAEQDAPPSEQAVEVEALSLPPERPPGRILGEGKDAVAALVAVLRTEVKIF